MKRAILIAAAFMLFGCPGSIDLPPPFCPAEQCTICGDGQQLGQERCDDGNADSGDGCSSECQIETGFSCSAEAPSLCNETCGDAQVVGAESCDDGNLFANDGCSPDCRQEDGWTCMGAGPGSCVPCGDGQREGAEECDDGNTDPGDGCSPRCLAEPGFVCDMANPSVCSPRCGDGVAIGNEACDDANSDDGDGCSAACVVEEGWTCDGTGEGSCSPNCGDGRRRGPETDSDRCDDDNTISGDGCSGDCRVEARWACVGEPSVCTGVCGDGFIRGTETCDDGALTAGDGCDAMCQTELGYVCLGEPSMCELRCGDGVRSGNEACDDGNNVPGDGCNSNCVVETGFSCTGDRPSMCAAVCGDGVRLGAETCDDANTAAGDGCDSSCQVEPGCGCEGEGAGSCACFLFPVRSLAAGSDHSCAVLENGSARCWGDNTHGQLGTGTMTGANRPQPVSGLTTTASLAARLGAQHSCVQQGATARCWGGNNDGQLGVGGGNRTVSTPVMDLVGVAASVPDCARPIVNGLVHSCAVLSDETLVCWGGNGSGRLGDGTTTSRSSLAPATGLRGVSCAVAGDAHTCARLSDGTVRCWGDNARGQLGDGSTRSRATATLQATLFSEVTSLAAGGDVTCAIGQNRTLSCWGANEVGQLGVGAGPDLRLPRSVTGLSDVREVSVGGRHVCALTGTGALRKLWCWGANERGQVGDGTLESRDRPVEIFTDQSVVSLSLGADHSCALLADRSLRCWGANSSGQLGTGTMDDAMRPTPVLR